MDVLVIGAGASGLMAAITAAKNGAKVTLLEKNKQTGKKLLVTGNGRCNFTNKDQKLEHYRSEAPEFVREALSQFSMGDTVRFFEKLGIRVKDRGGTAPEGKMQMFYGDHEAGKERWPFSGPHRRVDVRGGRLHSGLRFQSRAGDRGGRQRI